MGAAARWEVVVGSTRTKKRIIGDSQRVDPMRLDGLNGFVALSALTSPTPLKRPKPKDGPPALPALQRALLQVFRPADRQAEKQSRLWLRALVSDARGHRGVGG
jgi:hypothetical protein